MSGYNATDDRAGFEEPVEPPTRFKKRRFFRGRAGRKEFWTRYVLYLGTFIPLWLLSRMDQFRRSNLDLIVILFALILLVPLTFKSAQRLRDTGLPGSLSLLQFMPLVIGVALMITYWPEKPKYVDPMLDLEWLTSPEAQSMLPKENNELRQAFMTYSIFRTPDAKSKLPEAVLKKFSEYDAYKKTDEYKQIEAQQALVKNTWLYSLLASFVLHIVTLGFMLRRSQPSPNKYGPNPNEVTP